MTNFTSQRAGWALATAVLGAALMVSASARAQDVRGVVLPLPPEDQQMIAAQLGPIVNKPLPSMPIDDVSVYFPLEDKQSVYRVTAGRHAGNMQTLALAKINRPNGKLAWRFEFSPSLTGFLRQTPEGDLMMPSIGDAREGVVVVTKPANPFVVKGIKPGETRSYLQKVLVNALDDPTDLEYSGTLNGTYTYLGAHQVTVPAGTYETVLFRIKAEGRIGPVHTHDSAYYFFAPHQGVVAMISQEDATAFWIIHIDTTSGRVLAAK
jgi:hypothetical protein